MKPIFLILEGIDGCGKGEQVKLLQNFFYDKNKRIDVFTTREPTYGQYGMAIRHILKTEEDPKSSADELLNLFTKDRAEHISTIKCILNNVSGELCPVVICDRYYHSTYAFQQTQGVPFERIHETQKNFLKPTITLLLDIEARAALERISNGRRGIEKFEKLDFMTELRQNYLKLKSQLDEDIVIIDAAKSIPEVFQQILEVLMERGLV